MFETAPTRTYADAFARARAERAAAFRGLLGLGRRRDGDRLLAAGRVA